MSDEAYIDTIRPPAAKPQKGEQSIKDALLEEMDRFRNRHLRVGLDTIEADTDFDTIRTLVADALAHAEGAEESDKTMTMSVIMHLRLSLGEHKEEIARLKDKLTIKSAAAEKKNKMIGQLNAEIDRLKEENAALEREASMQVQPW